MKTLHNIQAEPRASDAVFDPADKPVVGVINEPTTGHFVQINLFPGGLLFRSPNGVFLIPEEELFALARRLGLFPNMGDEPPLKLVGEITSVDFKQPT